MASLNATYCELMSSNKYSLEFFLEHLLKKVPELYLKTGGNTISTLENEVRGRNIYKINDIEPDMAIAIKLREKPEIYERYINKDYLWSYQMHKIAKLVLLIAVLALGIILCYRIRRAK